MLWDASAGHCIIEEAGGKVIWADNQQPMSHNIKHMKNQSFIAFNQLPRLINHEKI